MTKQIQPNYRSLASCNPSPSERLIEHMNSLILESDIASGIKLGSVICCKNLAKSAFAQLC